MLQFSSDAEQWFHRFFLHCRRTMKIEKEAIAEGLSASEAKRRVAQFFDSLSVDEYLRVIEDEEKRYVAEIKRCIRKKIPFCVGTNSTILDVIKTQG